MIRNISEELKIRFHLNWKADNGLGSLVNGVERSVNVNLCCKRGAFSEEGAVHADKEFILYVDHLGNVQGQERQI